MNDNPYRSELARALEENERMRVKLAEAWTQRNLARDVAVQLENELASLSEAHDHTLAALYRAGVELCECRGENYPKHVRGVPGCTLPHDIHEDRRAAA